MTESAPSVAWFLTLNTSTKMLNGEPLLDDINDKEDPNCVGSLMNPFLTNGNLVTFRLAPFAALVK